MASTHTPIVRRAVESDSYALLTLVDALADYEKLTPPTPDAKERLVQDMFGPKRRIDGLLAFMDGYPVGYAIILETYSSFLALPTLYLEDLFVLPEYRGRKVGYAIFNELKAEAERRGCGRIDWTVLDWNRIAIDFYERLGAECMKEWKLYRLRLV